MISIRPLAILAVEIAVLVLAIGARDHAGDVAGIAVADLAAIIWRAAALVIAGTLAVIVYQGQLGAMVRTALVLVGLGSVASLAYAYRGELFGVAHHALRASFPDIDAQARHAPQVEVPRARSGDFTVRVEVNRRRVVPMVIDTGATSVVLTTEAAKAAGLPVEFLRYDVVLATANGRAKAASVVVDSLTVGDIKAYRVPVLVAEPSNNLKVSLLGMTFLNRLDSYEVRGDRLVMRGRPAG